MDILQLREFKVVAEMQNVSRAAEVLHIAQPALSRTIRNIEEELSIKLFDRRGRNIYLNQNGAILLKYTNDILNSIDQLKMELAEATFLSFSTMPINFYAASALIPYIAKEFRRLYPNIKLQLYRQPAGQFHKGNRGRLFLYASVEPTAGENTTLLLQERIFATIPRANPLAEKESISLSDLRSENIIACTKEVSLRENMDHYFKKAGIRPNIVLECDDPSAIRNLISDELGISFFPQYSWGPLPSTANVVLRSIRDPDCVRYLYLAWGGDSSQKPRNVIVFEQFIRDIFAKMQTAGGSPSLLPDLPE